ncbi:MAG: hypothetical protein JST84_15150 [Acidobacteria bacterium]|nr:hypothetical protein [Acidobacteriota bacterium]
MKTQTHFGITFVLFVLLFVASAQAQSQDPKAWIRNGDAAWQQGNTAAALVNYNYAFNNLGWDWSSALTLTQRYLALGQESQALNAYRFGVQLAWNWAIDPNTLQLRPQAQSVASGEQGLATAINQYNNTFKNMRMSEAARNWLQQAAKQAYDSYQLLQQKKAGTTTTPTTPPTTTLPPPVASRTDWNTNADALQIGQRYSCSCPANGTLSYVYGFDVYRSDVSICTAAVQAGLITQAAGGTVVIEVRPGQPYAPGSRNGIVSSSGAASAKSYVFVRR